MSREYNPYFDKEDEISFWEGGHLPHRHQDCKLQFVTFRLADSLPQSVLRELVLQKKEFLELHPKPWNELTAKFFNEKYGKTLEEWLDKGIGECILRNPEVRKIVNDVLRNEDGNSYDIISYVIMPNHVHLLIELNENSVLKDIMQRIKSLTAHKINQYLGRKGNLWMRESYDRLIRSEDHLRYVIHYIERNPRFLKPSDYTLYSVNSHS